MGKIDDRSIKMFTEDHFSLQMVGDFFDCTRQGVKKYLNKRGIDTSKKGGLSVVCDSCGGDFIKPRYRVRESIKNYCSAKCYYKGIENPDYIQNRQGCRNAHQVILECGYRVVSPEVAHHVDGDDNNNDPENLMVFKNQSDHMRWHRAGHEDSGVVPVWRGDGKPLLKKVKTPKGPVKMNEKMASFMPYPKTRQLGKKKK